MNEIDINFAPERIVIQIWSSLSNLGLHKLHRYSHLSFCTRANKAIACYVDICTLIILSKKLYSTMSLEIDLYHLYIRLSKVAHIRHKCITCAVHISIAKYAWHCVKVKQGFAPRVYGQCQGQYSYNVHHQSCSRLKWDVKTNELQLGKWDISRIQEHFYTRLNYLK